MAVNLRNSLPTEKIQLESLTETEKKGEMEPLHFTFFIIEASYVLPVLLYV